VLTKAKLTYIKDLLQKKHREAEGKFVVEGWKSIEEAIHAGVEIETIVYDEQKFQNIKIIDSLRRSAQEVFPAKAKEIDSIADTVTTQGIIGVLPKLSREGKLKTTLKKPTAIIVVLDGITDPGNLGTIIRTCDWFGVDALISANNSVDLYNPKVVRATMGSLFHLPIIETEDITSVLSQSKQEQFSVYSTELSNSIDIRKTAFAKKSIIVIGNESHGVSKDISILADAKILIPQFGKAESLNAAMACGIILSYIRLK
jgi:TrmH family RNA methyltransferase